MNKPTLHVLIFRSKPDYSWNASLQAPKGIKPDEVWEGIDFNLAGYNREDDDQCVNDTDYAMICGCAARQYEKQTGLIFFEYHLRQQ